ncbi:PEP-CTERM sorting domain-containing protein [Crocosphaera sp. UHCC 0190]|uniref:PEP-CTERM sorting domain-containing protein n=1 Tax=Crocosphaera sp. UHCC 0190 TaxID=3110246 RepID=UPI002B216417|nr:PEP-CTERM sorting domain-containing protein [Crocosphaera sp. UHCC 0190]MEA5508710.1 PEP-CTERM sorting domain-containing protein [Crocosphaera sp. UHCC 0190]
MSIFSFKPGVLGAVAVIPFAAAGVMTFTASAEAAAIQGDFSFSGAGSVNLSLDQLTFNAPTTFNLSGDSSTGSFGGFTQGGVKGPLSFTGNNVVAGWLDFGNDSATIQDGMNTFTATGSSFTLSEMGRFVSVEVLTTGFFLSSTGELSEGEVFFTLQKRGTLAGFNTILNNGGTVEMLTYSGSGYAVPEPLTMLGAGTAVLFGGAFKRQLNKKGSAKA